MTRSVLDDIPGLGEVRRKRLLKRFGSVKRLRAAPLDDIRATPGLPGSVAEAVYDALHDDRREAS
ncbi:MAG: helix-hairpin-helix domain-containing protein, partial [Actinomycetota bacterium]